ncbi:hypothetical protein ACFY0F_26470 [Streptomyces sp. NPDC001544]|uniref:hypothetical protein n=1 Tax=Streptomyces sp. NPDC001544 TaxID=3364584 RepID=UPI0036C46B3E
MRGIRDTSSYLVQAAPVLRVVRFAEYRYDPAQVVMIRLTTARLVGEEIEPRGPIETGAASRLADDLKNE